MNGIPWIDDLPKDEVVAIAREEHEELGALMVLHEIDQNEIERLRAEITTLRGAMDAQDERERVAGEKSGIIWHEYGCDWPDAAADRILHLRAEVEGLENALEDQHAGTDAVWNEKAELVKEVERLQRENERIETEAHGIDESLSLLSQQYKTLEAEVERLRAEMKEPDVDRLFREGDQAAEDSDAVPESCPYRRGTREHRWWTRGFAHRARILRAISAELEVERLMRELDAARKAGKEPR